MKICLLVLLVAGPAGAVNESPQSFTLDGTLLAADHISPLRDATAKVRVQILSPSKACVLYDEEQTVNTLSSEGHFNIQVGSAVGASKRRALDSANAMALVYQNASSIPARAAPSQTCAGSSYSPAAGDVRYVRVIVTPTAGSAETLSPDMVLDSAPSALVAQSLQGLEKNGFIQVNPAAQLTQAKLEQFIQALTAVPGMGVSYDGTNFTSYDPKDGGRLTSGTVADSQISDLEWAKITSVPPAINAVATLSCANGEILKFISGAWTCGTESGVGVESDPNVSLFAKTTPGTGLTTDGSNHLIPDFGVAAGKVAQGNDSRFTDSRAPNGSASGDLSGSYPNPVVAKLQGHAVSAAVPAEGQVLKYDNGTSTWIPVNFGIDDLKTSLGGAQFISASCTSAQTLIWSAVTDAFQCTDISLPVAQVTGNLPFSQVSGTVPIAQGGTGATTSSGALNALLPSQSGQNGKVLQSDGTNASWQTAAASGVTSLNGSSQGIQTLATPGSAGLAPNWSTNTGTGAHTLNIPMASGASVTAGLISKADYDSFGSKLGSESDPKVGANTANYLSKWNGSALVASGIYENGGNVGVGTASPHASAALDISSTTKGFLPPRMNSAARLAISSPADGLVVYDTTDSSLYLRKSAAWQKVSDGGVLAAKVVRSSNLSVANSTWTTIPLSSATWDTGGLWSAGSPSVLTIPAGGAGTYVVTLNAAFDSASSTGPRWAQLLRNGVNVVGSYCNRMTGAEGGYAMVTCTFTQELDAGDTISMQVLQSSGGALNVMGAYTSLSAARLNGTSGGGGGGADNLGNHVMSQPLVTSGNWISGDGDPEGIAVDGSGNVGIGSSSPAAKLDVAGTIRPQGATSGAVCSPLGAQAYDSTSGAPLYCSNSSVWTPVGGGGSGSGILILADEKAAGTGGGTCTAGSWQTRTLNTVRVNSISGASLSSNQFTLPAGSYEIWASAPSYRADETQAKLTNISASTTVVIGSMAQSNNAASNAVTNSVIVGYFTIATSQVFAIQQRCQTTYANGFGAASPGFGVNEVYTVVKIQKQ